LSATRPHLRRLRSDEAATVDLDYANTAGTLTANQRFDAWGVKTSSSGTIPQYGYTGREPDATGLVYYRARYYHPGLGRFASRDPMGMADSVSPYAYVANNPTNLIDPMGLHSMDPVLVAGDNGIQKYWGAFKQTMADVGSGLYDLLPSKQSLDEFVQSPAGQGAINGLTASGIQGDMPIAAAGAVPVVGLGTRLITRGAAAGCPVQVSAACFRLPAHRFFFPFNRPVISPSSLLHRIRFVLSLFRHPCFVYKLFSSFARRLVELHPGQSFCPSACFVSSVARCLTFANSSLATTHPTPRTSIRG